MRSALELCARFAVAPWPVLLLGEPGTGKSVIAQHIHRLSTRIGEFFKHSLGSHTHELEYDTLAGHAAGSFTGASGERKGLVEAAHQGTLFLDETALAPPSVQDLLLDLLDEGYLRRLGENRPRPVNVRLIFATNADLPRAVQEQRFRQDLLDRIGHLKITLPPLRDRRDEILPLARYFLRTHADIFPGYEPALTTAVAECLVNADWPGNIRDLERTMQYSILMAYPEPGIRLAHLPPHLHAGSIGSDPDDAPGSTPSLAEALAQAGGVKSHLARQLGISRKHLYTLIKKEQRTSPLKAV